MSEQNNLFQIYKIKCQTQANANACQKSRAWVCESDSKCASVLESVGELALSQLMAIFVPGI